MKDLGTEEKILQAAVTVFQQKGMSGARMQEIADEARINKAMLHYYFRSKQQLFEAVFLHAFEKLAPQLNLIFASEEPLFDKIRSFTASYIDFILENPYLPSFIVQEMNNNPEFVDRFAESGPKPDPRPLLRQIETEVRSGTIRPVDSRQLLLNLLSLCAFPFVARRMIHILTDVSDPEFLALMDERKTLVADLIIESIKA